MIISKERSRVDGQVQIGVGMTAQFRSSFTDILWRRKAQRVGELAVWADQFLLFFLLLHPSWQLQTIKGFKRRRSCSVSWHRFFHIIWGPSPAMLTLPQVVCERINKFRKHEEQRKKREILRKKKKEKEITKQTKEQRKNRSFQFPFQIKILNVFLEKYVCFILLLCHKITRTFCGQRRLKHEIDNEVQ